MVISLWEVASGGLEWVFEAMSGRHRYHSKSFSTFKVNNPTNRMVLTPDRAALDRLVRLPRE